jgi:hypothetical protein
VGLTNLGSELEKRGGSRVHLVGVSISFEKNIIGSHSLPPLWFTVSVLQQGRDIVIVQVYVDDIVFGGSSNSLVARFAEDMNREFEMSMMGELQLFLGLQIKQSKEGTFVHQAKYTKDIVRKFKMEDSKAMTTPMSTTTTLDADEEGEHVD